MWSHLTLISLIFGCCKKRNGLRGNFGKIGIDADGRSGSGVEKFGIAVELSVGNCAANIGFRRWAKGPSWVNGLVIGGFWPEIIKINFVSA